MRSILHGALEQAVKNNIIPRNVCDAVSLPAKRQQEFIPWTTEQANAFLTSVQESRLFALYLTAWGSGCRRSELTWIEVARYRL